MVFHDSRPRPPGLGAILVLATAAELSGLCALLGLVALAGLFDGWADVAAQFAPIWLAMGAVGAVLARLAVADSGTRRGVLIVAAVGVLINAGLTAPDLCRGLLDRAWSGKADAGVFKVLTFNVWDENRSPMHTVAAAVATGADLIAVQEVGGIAGAPRKRLIAAGYPYHGGWAPDCDMEIFSRRPLRAVTDQPMGSGADAFCVLSALTTAPDGGPVRIVTTHMDWPFPPERYQKETEALGRLVAPMRDDRTVLTGDFNACPWSQALRGQDAALAPLTRRTHGVFSWPAQIALLHSPSPLPVLAIDQVFAGAGWRTLGARRIARAGSDHYGVLVSLAPRAGAHGQ